MSDIQARVQTAIKARSKWRIQMGTALIAARRDCREGDWLAFLRQVDIPLQTARLMMNEARAAHLFGLSK